MLTEWPKWLPWALVAVQMAFVVVATIRVSRSGMDDVSRGMAAVSRGMVSVAEAQAASEREREVLKDGILELCRGREALNVREAALSRWQAATDGLREEWERERKDHLNVIALLREELAAAPVREEREGECFCDGDYMGFTYEASPLGDRWVPKSHTGILNPAHCFSCGAELGDGTARRWALAEEVGTDG